MILIFYLIKGKRKLINTEIHPSISFIIVVHNGENLIINKIENTLSLNHLSEDYEIIVFSDGSTDKTGERVKNFIDKSGEKRIKFLSSLTHEGKNSAINKAVENSSKEIIVFSDADAILEADAMIHLIKHFSDPRIGGVCGRRIISEDNKKLNKPQSDYIKFDTTIKLLESKIDSISSNDGKLYAIRRNLFQFIPSAVTDDLYMCLLIVKQRYLFLLEPEAKAFIKAPSRDISHEIKRRRRIVSTSLRGIYLMRELLNPLKYGFFSIRLIINKVIRRGLPFCLLLIFFSSLYLSFYNSVIKIFFILQIIFYILALLHWVLLKNISGLKLIKRITSLSLYFCIGNFGTLLGVIDLLMGKKITKWEPLKVDR